MAVFDIAEKFISGFIHTAALSGAIEEVSHGINNVWIGGAVVVFFSFIPFFAFKELSRVMGLRKCRVYFLGKEKNRLFVMIFTEVNCKYENNF